MRRVWEELIFWSKKASKIEHQASRRIKIRCERENDPWKENLEKYKKRKEKKLLAFFWKLLDRNDNINLHKWHV